jgi:hypothetical protein
MKKEPEIFCEKYEPYLDKIEFPNEYKGYIVYDKFANSPRNFEETAGTLISLDSRFDSDKNAPEINTDNFISLDEIIEYVKKEYNAINMRVITAYIHGGISLYSKPAEEKITKPADIWDTGIFGIIYTTKEKIKQLGIEPNMIDKVLESEIKDLDDYLNGNVYSYIICNPKNEIIEYTGSEIGKDGLNFLKEELKEVDYKSYEENQQNVNA